MVIFYPELPCAQAVQGMPPSAPCLPYRTLCIALSKASEPLPASAGAAEAPRCAWRQETSDALGGRSAHAGVEGLPGPRDIRVHAAKEISRDHFSRFDPAPAIRERGPSSLGGRNVNCPRRKLTGEAIGHEALGTRSAV